MAQSEELLPVVTEKGEIIGKELRSVCHGGSKSLHPVVHLHVFLEDGSLLLQRRSMTKKIQPGKWDTAVGGHVSYGESVKEALSREVSEEIGLTDFTPKFIKTYVFESSVERELINCFFTVVDKNFKPIRETTDIDELRFFTSEELAHMISEGTVTPNFAREYTDLISHITL